MSSVPTEMLSTLNWTPVTPTLSEALAERVTEVPETVVPDDGADMETVGMVVSPVPVVLKEALTRVPDETVQEEVPEHPPPDQPEKTEP